MADRGPQTLRLSDSQTLRLSDPQTLRPSDLLCTAAAAGAALNGTAAGVCAFCTGDSPLAHLLVVSNMGVRKLPLRLEEDRDSHPGHCKADKNR